MYFQLADNALDNSDVFVFQQDDWNTQVGSVNMYGTGQRYPLIMNGAMAMFDPRYTNATLP